MLMFYILYLRSLEVTLFVFFFFKQKTAYEMRMSDWSSDVCSSDLADLPGRQQTRLLDVEQADQGGRQIRQARRSLRLRHAPPLVETDQRGQLRDRKSVV